MNWIKAGLALIAAGLWSSDRCSGATYRFAQIHEAPPELVTIEGDPAINDRGDVAFAMRPRGGGTILYRYRDSTLAAIVQQYPGVFTSPPSINNLGQIAIVRSRFDGDEVVVGDGVKTTLIAKEGDEFTGVFDASLNSSGSVAFRARVDGGASLAVVIGDGRSTTIAAKVSDPRYDLGPAVIDDAGTVTYRLATNIESRVIASRDSALADVLGPTSVGTDNSLSVNSRGVAALLITWGDVETGIYTAEGGSLRPVALDSGPYSFDFARFAFQSNVAINDAGRVAFRARLDSGGYGIFTGPDPVANSVIKTGDSLNGSTVVSLGFTRAMNQRGQIAFRYVLANDMTGIVLATPVPEPTALSIVIVLMCLARSAVRVGRGSRGLRYSGRR
jgi:hypothetical protein